MKGKTKMSIFILAILLSISGCEREARDSGPSLSVKGIMYDKEDPKALVAGEIVGVGDTVRGAEIVGIAPSHVTFKYKGEVFTKDLIVTREDILRSEKAAKAKAAARGKRGKKKWWEW